MFLYLSGIETNKQNKIMQTIKFINKETTAIQDLLKTIDWISVEFKSETIFENVKQVNTCKEIKNCKNSRTMEYFVDGKKVHNHARFLAEELMNEKCILCETKRTTIIKIN